MKAATKTKATKKMRTDDGPVPVDATNGLEALFAHKDKLVDHNAAAQSFEGRAGTQAKASVTGTVVSAHKDKSGAIFVTALVDILSSGGGAINVVAGHLLTTKKVDDAQLDVEDAAVAMALATTSNDKGGGLKAKPIIYDGPDVNGANGPTPLAQRIQHTLAQFNFRWALKDKEVPGENDKIMIPNATLAFGRDGSGPFLNGSNDFKIIHKCEEILYADRIDAVFEDALHNSALSKAAAVTVSKTFGYGSSVPHGLGDEGVTADMVRRGEALLLNEQSAVVQAIETLKTRTNPTRDHPRTVDMLQAMAEYAKKSATEDMLFPGTRCDSVFLQQLGSLHSKIPGQVKVLLDEIKFELMPQTFVAPRFNSIVISEKNSFMKACGTVSIVYDKHEVLRALKDGNPNAIIDTASGRGDEPVQHTVGVKLYVNQLAKEFQISDVHALMCTVKNCFQSATFMVGVSIVPGRQGAIAPFPDEFTRSFILNLRQTIKENGVPVTKQFVEEYLGRKGGNLNGRKKTPGPDPEFVDMERVATVKLDGLCNVSEIQGTSTEDLDDEAASIGKTLRYYLVDGALIPHIMGDPASQQCPESGDAFVKMCLMVNMPGDLDVATFDAENGDHKMAMRAYLAHGGTAIVFAVAV